MANKFEFTFKDGTILTGNSLSDALLNSKKRNPVKPESTSKNPAEKTPEESDNLKSKIDDLNSRGVKFTQTKNGDKEVIKYDDKIETYTNGTFTSVEWILDQNNDEDIDGSKFEPVELDTKFNEQLTGLIKQYMELNKEIIKEKNEYNKLKEEIRGIKTEKSMNAVEALEELKSIDKKIEEKDKKLQSMVDKNEEWRKIYDEINILEENKLKPHSILYPNAYKAFNKINPENTYPIDVLSNTTDKKGNYQDPMTYHQRTFHAFQEINEDEGYFDMSILGFYKILKNREDVSNKNGIDSKSRKAIYKVIGPDGSILIDNVGYKEASKFMDKESEKYKIKLEKEFSV